MYRVQSITNDRWEIADSQDRLVFVGTKRQAEEWLDYQDNAVPQPAHRGAWARALFQSLRRFVGRLAGSCQPTTRQRLS